MRKPNLQYIIFQLEKGKDFTLTRQQYIDKTGVDIPQDKSYTKNRSAVANKAREYNFSIEVIPEKLIFHKEQ